ncbi:MAG: ketoacyl-ACP synthase III [Deltaproteobacteria bacterium]|nr:ketoacyl-ACP synthase III [Deltaproteobacteria bacterium]
MIPIRILGSGSYVPSKILTNDDLREMGLDTTDEWIVQRTGIRERRIADPGVTTADLAVKASKKALAMAGLTPKDLDLIILGTITPDTCCPSGANWLENKLGAVNAVSFDVTAACSGFIFALNVASQYLNSGTYKRILVAASEVMSRVVNWKDRSTCILWGDGSGAVVLTPGDEGHQLLSTHIHSDGAEGEDLLVPGGGSRSTPITHETVDKDLHSLKLIEANASFRVAVRHFVESIKEAVKHNHLTLDDIKWFIPHQANLRMFQAMSKSLKLPMDRFYVTIDKYGNSSSAACAIAFADAVEDGSIQEGDHVCLPVFGGGLTWGSALIRW